MKDNSVPEDFSKFLLEKYRDYGNSENHKNAFRYFATRILPAVNASLTKFDKRKYKESLSQCFSYTDEAFGILLVVNYENRWQSQHEAEVRLPGTKSKERSKEWDDARYTSAFEGARRGVSWTRAGLVKFNELSEMVKAQRGAEGEDNKVETELMAWCRAEARLPQLDKGEGGGSSGVVHDEVEEEDEVEALGECSIFEV